MSRMVFPESFFGLQQGALDLGVDGAFGDPMGQAYQPVQMGEQIGAAQGGQRGIEGLEEVLVEAVHKAPQGEGFAHPGVSGQQQDPAAAFDVIQPGGAFFQGLGIEDILGLDVFIKRELL